MKQQNFTIEEESFEQTRVITHSDIPVNLLPFEQIQDLSEE